jgi:tetratricopeptide (TPR) repeat protein
MRYLLPAILLLLLSNCESRPGRTEDMESYLRARTLYLQGDLPGTRRILEAPDRGVRRLPAGRLLLGKTLYFQGEPAAAQEELAFLVKENPHHIDAAKWLARSYLELSDPESARRALVAALEVSSEDPELLVLMGRSYNAMGRTDMSIEYFLKATAFTPRFATGHLELAEVYRAAGLPEEALRHALRAESILGEAP